MTAGIRSGSAWGILVAGGRGRRFGGETPKQFAPVKGRMLLAHTLEALAAYPGLEGITLVLPEEHLEQVRGKVPCRIPLRMTLGGVERADSVFAGLETVPPEIESVFVHDAVRPCVSQDLLKRLHEASRWHAAVIPALRPADTVKEVDADGRVTRTLDRSRLVMVQTPQVFRREILRESFLKAQSTMTMSAHTDCASLVEASDHPVVTVPGDPENIKVTTPRDLSLVDDWLRTADERAMT